MAAFLCVTQGLERSTLGFVLVVDHDRTAVLALGRGVALDELDHRHRGGVAEAEARLQHAQCSRRCAGCSAGERG